MNKVKQSFIQGTMILLLAGMVNRILGFVPRITLPRVIGAEGIGLYQMGFPLLNIMITIITGGLPLAIAKLVSEAESNGDERLIRRILWTSLLFVLSAGVLFLALSIWITGFVGTHLLTDTRVIPTLYAMSPIIVVVGISSVFRGYFQGRHNMIPTASSQIIETILRIFAMLALAWLLLPYGVEWAAAGAMLGVLTGEIGGMAALILQFRKIKPLAQPESPDESGHRTAFRKLLRISIPVTGSRLVGSGSYFLESIITVQSLAAAGIAAAAATAQYGALQGMVIPILLLPGVLTYSLSISLVPSLSEAAARGDMRTIHRRLNQSMRLALVAGTPFAVFMYILAEPLTQFLYADASVGSLLKLMAPVALFLYFQSPMQAALQALDHPGKALFNSFAGACVKLMLIVWLAAKLKMGIVGVIVAININIVLVTLLHYTSLVRTIRFTFRWSDLLRVAVCAACMAAPMLLIMSDLWQSSPFVKFMLAALAGLLTYSFAIIAGGLVDKHDMIRIPWIGTRLRLLKQLTIKK